MNMCYRETKNAKEMVRPKGTILELFWLSLCQACHRLISSRNWSCSTVETVRHFSGQDSFTRHLPGKPEACFDDAMPIATVFRGCRAMYRPNGLQKEEVLAS
jgi:hypothetical protein